MLINLHTKTITRKGFTLIEVLLAFVIFAGAFTMLASILFNTLQARTLLENSNTLETNTRIVRQSVLQLSKRDDVESGGEVPVLDDKSLSWEAEVEQTSLLNLFKVTLNIQMDDTNKEQTLYVLRPAWTEASEGKTLMSDAKERVQGTRSEQ